MKIGISTACLYPMLTEKALEEVGKSGIKNVEIFFNSTGELEKDFVSQLKTIKDNFGLNIISVHPTFSLAESFVFFSAYDRRKDEGLEVFKRYGEITAELGAKYVILHGGKPNGILSDRQYFDRFGEIAAAVKLNGGTLLQENVVKFRANDLGFLKKMCDYLGEGADICLDVKQSIRGGYSPFDAVKLLRGNIKHIHLSDNSPDKDCEIPFNGTFDMIGFLEYAEKCGYKGNCIVEVYRDAYNDYSDLFSSVERLRKEYGNAEKIT